MAFPLPAPELLSEGLRRLGFPETDGSFPGSGEPGLRVRGIGSLIPLIEKYLKELELFNAAFDLVGADNRSDLIVRHVLDSLAPWKETAALLAAAAGAPEGLRVPRAADAGSGAGFPGIPLAIAFPEVSFTLIERMSKRCAFLENCAAMLRLSNVTVMNREVEKAPSEAFDVVVFRAFRPLDAAMTKTLLRLLAKPAGRLAAWKAREAKISEEMGGIASLVGGYEVLPLAVPFLDSEERNLVVIRP